MRCCLKSCIRSGKSIIRKGVITLHALFQAEPIPFSRYHSDIAWLAAHGVVDNVEGVVDVTVPLYKKAFVMNFLSPTHQW